MLKLYVFLGVVIIKKKRFLSFAVAITMIYSLTAQMVFGEGFEEVTENPSDSSISMDSAETTLDDNVETTVQNPPIEEPPIEEPPIEEPPIEEPPVEEPPIEEPPVEEPIATEPPVEETVTETTVEIQKAAFVYTVSNNEAVLVSCKTPALEKIDVPEIIDGYPVTTIADNVFDQCYNVIEINLPYSVKTISEGAFKMCNRLQYIGVATENKHYKSVNGVLYNFNGTSIIAYPADKEDTSYSIAEGVQYVGSSCFNSCSNLESLKLPPTLALIGYSAFNGCINLKELTVNNNVEISQSMFENCNLDIIYGYENSKAEDYAELCNIEFQSIGVLETQATTVSTEEVTEETTTIEETTIIEETVSAETLVYYDNPERPNTDATEKLVIVIIIVAMISLLVAVASRSRRNRDDDDEDDDDDEEYEDIDEDDDND